MVCNNRTVQLQSSDRARVRCAQIIAWVMEWRTRLWERLLAQPLTMRSWTCDAVDCPAQVRDASNKQASDGLKR